MREYLTAVAGNIALRQRLGAELEAGTIAHAYIIEGPTGCGKTTMATALSMALACERHTQSAHPLPCGQCDTCQKIMAGNSPDVIHVYREKDKASMGIGVIRDLRGDVATVPNDLSFKVYIIHDAHTMTDEAQNALLLTLEEPPAFVLFLLLAEDAGTLLETIRSRAPILRMQPVRDSDIEGYLLSPHRERKLLNAASALRESAPEEFAALIRMANGCIGVAISLLDEAKRAPMLENRQTVSEICRHLAQRTRPDELLQSLLALGTKRTEVIERLRLLTIALRDLLLFGYSEQTSLLFFTCEQTAADLSSRFTSHRLLAHLDAVDGTISALSVNGNVRLLLVQLFNRLTQS